MVGRLIRLMVTTVAPTTPVEAARMAPTITTEKPRPPRRRPKSWPMVTSRLSAMPERSSTSPMKMNSGTATSVSLSITPKKRGARLMKRMRSKWPTAWPSTAKSSDTPASVKATG